MLKSYKAKQKVYELEFNTQDLMTKQSRINLANGIAISEEEKKQIDIYEEKKQKLTEINNLITQEKLKIKELNDESFMGNFTQGLRSGTQALGSFKSMTQDLGKSVVSTMTDGITNSLFGMVKALETGKNAWKSFKDGLGNILTSIS